MQRTFSPKIVPFSSVNFQEKHNSKHSHNENKHFQQLRKYHHDLKSPSFLSDLNSKLESEEFASKMGSELLSYYQSHPNLKEYTIKKELHRMQYVLKTREGKRISDVKSFAAHARRIGEKKEQQQQKNSPSTKSKQNNEEEEEEIIMRASNQSLLADAIAFLSSLDGLIRPQHSASSNSERCQFFLNFKEEREELGNQSSSSSSTPSRKYVSAICEQTLSIPTCRNSSSSSSSTKTKQKCQNEAERLILAKWTLSVKFIPSKPSLVIRVVNLDCDPRVTDKDLQMAAAFHDVSPVCFDNDERGTMADEKFFVGTSKKNSNFDVFDVSKNVFSKLKSSLDTLCVPPK